MCNYWLHRISHWAIASYPLLEKGYLTIGFSDVLTYEPDFSSKVQNGDMDTGMFNSLIEKTYKTMGKSRWFLWHFIKDFQKGDKVIVPSWGSFAVFEILEPARPISDLAGLDIKFQNGRQLIVHKEKGLYINDVNGKSTPIDLGFYVKVVPQFNYGGGNFAPRSGFLPNNLLLKLKYRGTNMKMTDQATEIEKAIERVKKDERIDFHKIIAKNTITEIQKFMQQIPSDREFERLVKYYFEKVGASVDIPSKNASDKPEGGDADVIANFEELGITIFVQVKQHKKISDEVAVQQIKEYIGKQGYVGKQDDEEDALDEEDTLIGWVISAGDDFSEAAKEKANQGKRIRLINGKEFAQMLLNVGFSNINEVLKA